MLEILSFGAGVQSTTLLLMSCEGVLPKLDAAIFADTQSEPANVYLHLEWCKTMAEAAGIPIITCTAGNLRDDLIAFWGQRKSADGKRHASIPAFIANPDGSKGMVRRQCTGSYKIEVIEKAVRAILGLKRGQRWPLVPTIRQWIGISTDERQRMKVSMRPAVEMWHPLIEAEELHTRKPGRLYPQGLSRDDCLRWMDGHGYPEPPRSACTFCPFRSDSEWVRMKRENPADFKDAVEVDRLIRHEETKRQKVKGNLVGKPYIHTSLVPLGEVDFGDDDKGHWSEECHGICGV